MRVVNKYKTTIPQIIADLSKHGNIRAFNFDDLADYAERYVSDDLPNVFRGNTGT